MATLPCGQTTRRAFMQCRVHENSQASSQECLSINLEKSDIFVNDKESSCHSVSYSTVAYQAMVWIEDELIAHQQSRPVRDTSVLYLIDQSGANSR